MALTRIPHIDGTRAECIDNCFAAAQAAEHCADQCAEQGPEMARCLRLCRDVADLTTLHARFMSRDSTYSNRLAAVCADLCEECADECAQHDHEHCQIAEETLRKCVKTCREMAE